MNYDEILEHHLGETGPFFIVHILLLWLPPLMAGMIVLQTSFTGARKFTNVKPLSSPCFDACGNKLLVK
jgi:hypothetical protein